MATFNTKKEMIETLATKKGISKVKAKEMIEDVLGVMEDMIMDEMHDGLDVYGLARFEVKTVAEKTARNPKTGESIVVPKHNQIRAKVSSKIKKAVR